MDKVYIQVLELLKEYGIPLGGFLQLVKSGKLVLYIMIKPFEYEAIDSFDSYVDRWIARKRDKIEKQYMSDMAKIHYPDERISRAYSICQSIRESYHRQKNVRNIGVAEIIKHNHDKNIKSLADRDRIAIGLVVHLYIKFNEYEYIANSGNTHKRHKRGDTEIRKKDTQEACLFVEKKYGPILLNKSKDEVLYFVKEEMNYKEPYRQTFNDWYAACPFTRRAGNPHNRKNPRKPL